MLTTHFDKCLQLLPLLDIDGMSNSELFCYLSGMLPHLKVQVVNTKCANPTWPKIDGSCLPNNQVEIETVVDTTKLEGNESAKRFRGQKDCSFEVRKKR